MDIKPRPNHRQYLEILSRMSPADRLKKAFELSDFSKRLFITGLRQRFPDLPPDQFQKLVQELLLLRQLKSSADELRIFDGSVPIQATAEPLS